MGPAVVIFIVLGLVVIGILGTEASAQEIDYEFKKITSNSHRECR